MVFSKIRDDLPTLRMVFSKIRTTFRRFGWSSPKSGRPSDASDGLLQNPDDLPTLRMVFSKTPEASE
jgi:hypothetical protein